MDNIIGLGTCGCNIAAEFAKYPQYNVYGIDSEAHDMPNFIKIAKRKDHEMYEQKFPVSRVKKLLKDMGDEVLVVVGGSGATSGCSLRLLDIIKDKNVSILYIRPDIELLSYVKAMRERLVFSVLQEYTRCGLVDRIYLSDNLKLESILGAVPLVDYHQSLNNLLVHTFHMINVLSHSSPIINTFSEPNLTARITTFGIMDLEKGEEKPFYDIEYSREAIYYYAINNESLENDGELFKNIRQQIREKSKEHERKTCSYGIFPTNYDSNYVYFCEFATLVQGQIILEQNI